MALDNLRDLYQQVILEHYKKPKHRGRANPAHRQQRGHNPSCGDTIELTLTLNEDRNRIESAKFEGEGCAISMASADLMAGAIQGKTIEEALAMVETFQAMMKGQEEFPKAHRKLNVMQGVAQFPDRIKCANLTWHALRAPLEGEDKGVDGSELLSDAFISTEDDEPGV
ncbi:MAG: Fe-S cluster assembly sulfur transfer protein SufU [Prochlorothrix sp.]